MAGRSARRERGGGSGRTWPLLCSSGNATVSELPLVVRDPLAAPPLDGCRHLLEGEGAAWSAERGRAGRASVVWGLTGPEGGSVPGARSGRSLEGRRGPRPCKSGRLHGGTCRTADAAVTSVLRASPRRPRRA